MSKSRKSVQGKLLTNKSLRVLNHNVRAAAKIILSTNL